MKKLVCLLALGLIVGCGPSAQERYDAALNRLLLEQNHFDRLKEERAKTEEGREKIQARLSEAESDGNQAEIKKWKKTLEISNNNAQGIREDIEDIQPRISATRKKMSEAAKRLGL